MKKTFVNLIARLLMWILASILILVGMTDIILKVVEVMEMKSGLIFPFWDSIPTVYKIVIIVGLTLGVFLTFFGQKNKDFTVIIKSIARRFISIWLAIFISSYGFAKILKTQFQVPENIKEIPMGEQHPFWLTWYYFGFSREYALLLAGVEIGGAILLLFNRTKLIGAFILLPALINILSINKFYQISPEALQASFFFTLGLIYLIALDYEKLKVCFVDPAPKVPSSNQLFTNSVRILAIGASFGLIWLYANDSKLNPSTLRGVWAVESIKYNSGPIIHPNERDSILTKLYFEYQPEGEAILEYNRHVDRKFTTYQLSGNKDSLVIQFDNGIMKFKINSLNNNNMLLNGRYREDSITMNLTRIKEISR